MEAIEATKIITTTLTTSMKFSRYYDQFRIIYSVLVKISFPYIFLIATIGFITNTSTVLLLSKNFITKNMKNKWTLIALGMFDLRELVVSSNWIFRFLLGYKKKRMRHFCLT